MPDAATLEAPETKTTPPPAPAPHPGAIVVDLENLGKKPAVKTEVSAPPTDGAAMAAESLKASGKTSEEVAAAAAKALEAAKKPNDKEENLANLRKAREAAEAARKAAEEERDRVKAEMEALKTKAPELPEDVKSRLTKAEQLEKDLEETRRTVRQLDLSRDPEFQAKYNQPIKERITTMGQTALAAGVSETDWKAAVANWDVNQFAEMSEGMNPAQKIRFTTAWMAAEDLHQKQQEELKNADTTYGELQKQRQAQAEAQQKQYFTQNEQLAKSVMGEVLTPEALKEYEDLGPATEALLMKAARHELPAKDIFHQLAANQTLARVTVKQKSRIDELETQLAERDKKIAEQETFISNAAGAVPRGDAAGSSAAADDKTPIWKNIVVKTPG